MHTHTLAHTLPPQTAAFSLVDVACDIMVARDFYQRGMTGFFWASVVIFLIAQFVRVMSWSHTWRDALC